MTASRRSPPESSPPGSLHASRSSRFLGAAHTSASIDATVTTWAFDVPQLVTKRTRARWGRGRASSGFPMRLWGLPRSPSVAATCECLGS